MSIMDHITAFRGKPGLGWTPHSYMDYFFNGESVPISRTEPDPCTFRHDYYYNSRRNVLYKRVVAAQTTCNLEAGKVWKAISDR